VNAKEALAAASLLAPVVEEVAHYLAGRSDEEPAVLALLPAELRSQAALERARARSSKPPGGA
jgi:hypothetical protein